MELEKRIEFYKNKLAQQFDILDNYEGIDYTIVAENLSKEVKKIGETELIRRLVLLSYVPENLGLDYVESQIEKIPSIALSGFRSISNSKTTFFYRVFLMEKVSFNLIQKIRDYDFSRVEQGQFNYIVHAGIIIVDTSSNMIYSNKIASKFSDTFRIITPVEVIEDESIIEKD